MENTFSRDHFIIGYDDKILYVKHKEMFSFNFLYTLGYDPKQDLNEQNNLLRQSVDISIRMLSLSRKNPWLAPQITMVCSGDLNKEEVIHLHHFCELLGGVNITLTRVHSVIDFVREPKIGLIHTNYVIKKNQGEYVIKKFFFLKRS